jgi:hypothetical protein
MRLKQSLIAGVLINSGDTGFVVLSRTALGNYSYRKRLDPPKPLSALRERAADQLARLPNTLRTLDQAAPFEVKVSDALRSLALAMDKQSH